MISSLSLLFAIESVSRWVGYLQPAGWVLVAILMVLLCTILWLTNLIALPGNWLCVLVVAVYAWLGPAEGRIAIDYPVVIAAFVLALIGEALEFSAGAVGARKAGASKKSTLFSIIGSMVGAITGAILGLPIPLLGPVLAALLFGGIGASLGAMYGEWSDGRKWKDNWSVGQATFWGRTFGTLGKFSVGLFIVLLVLLATFV